MEHADTMESDMPDGGTDSDTPDALHLSGMVFSMKLLIDARNLMESTNRA